MGAPMLPVASETLPKRACTSCNEDPPAAVCGTPSADAVAGRGCIDPDRAVEHLDGGLVVLPRIAHTEKRVPRTPATTEGERISKRSSFFVACVTSLSTSPRRKSITRSVEPVSTVWLNRADIDRAVRGQAQMRAIGQFQRDERVIARAQAIALDERGAELGRRKRTAAERALDLAAHRDDLCRQRLALQQRGRQTQRDAGAQMAWVGHTIEPADEHPVAGVLQILRGEVVKVCRQASSRRPRWPGRGHGHAATRPGVLALCAAPARAPVPLQAPQSMRETLLPATVRHARRRRQKTASARAPPAHGEHAAAAGKGTAP